MKIITANRLADGVVVFLSGKGWVTEIAKSAVLSASDAVEAGMVAASQAVADREVVEAAAIDVMLDAQKSPVPVKLRERIRAFGPTVEYGEAALLRQAA